ncbi:DUF2478 domain-containing protein [uncultured Hyphomicrobium sp.]|jgi:nucleoside-triphosphatase THEP1|uniref:DUF2478 domain-containing protein n=1 Tax=uncultured Hyphomicrobium sp. TaxID=194373 RepID=UPI0025D868C6|nr:DUF2478 domain-containing protein [uncultured Hyphomicrobium sp.]
MADSPSIATVEGTDSAAVQVLFAKAIGRWKDGGLRVAGVVEETHGLPGRTCNAGVLRDIASSRSHSIFLATPPVDTSCHIDARGAEGACAAVLPQIADCDLVVLSKFGKLEAAHGGLFDAFVAAFEARKPILTTVSEKHRSAWTAFAPDSVVIEPTDTAIDAWRRSVTGG